MRTYDMGKLAEDYKDCVEKVNTRHNDDGVEPHQILESEAFNFACLIEIENRLQMEMIDGTKYMVIDDRNILEYLAEYMLGYDTLTFADVMSENTGIIWEVK